MRHPTRKVIGLQLNFITDEAAGASTFTRDALNSLHQEFLRARAVADDVAAERGYLSANQKSVLRQLGFGQAQQLVPALVIPIHSVRGEVGSYVLRPDAPRLNRQGKITKYEFRSGSTMLLDFHPRLTKVHQGNGLPPISNPNVPLIFTEGVPKADAALSIGLNCAALLGVFNFRGRNEAGGTTVLADWESIALNGRDVFIAFDSDAFSKAGVHAALTRLKTFLDSRKANVRIIYLPVGPHGEKLGLDDFIAQRKRAGLSDEEIRTALLALASSELHKLPRSTTSSNKPSVGARAPFDIADIYVELRRTRGNVHTLRHWNDSYWEWREDTNSYQLLGDGELRADITTFLKNDVVLYKSETETTEPNSWHISNTFDALRGIVHLGANRVSPPQFLREEDEVCSGRLIAVANGLLELSTETLYPATPSYFNLHAISAAYDRHAECPNWITFLNQVWPDDRESIDCLQEWFGYLLESRNDQQKALLIKGPKRAGKGTIAKMVAALKGRAAAKIDLTDLSDNFGVEQLIGKSVAIIPEARQDRKDPRLAVAMGRILGITGGDRAGVQRKYKSTFEPGVEPVFLVFCNILPVFPDSSGAVANRFVPLCIFQSFFGREDISLFEEKLKPEVSGVLNWAIKGWRRLQDRGRFVVPSSASGLLESFEEMSNSLSRFFAEKLTIVNSADLPTKFDSREKGFLLDKTEFYTVYVEWAKSRELKPKPYDFFYREISAMGIDADFRWDPMTTTTRRRNGTKAQRWVRGIKLIGQAEADAEADEKIMESKLLSILQECELAGCKFELAADGNGFEVVGNPSDGLLNRIGECEVELAGVLRERLRGESK
jgi:putative DNA primase/helicase